MGLISHGIAVGIGYYLAQPGGQRQLTRLRRRVVGLAHHPQVTSLREGGRSRTGGRTPTARTARTDGPDRTGATDTGDTADRATTGTAGRSPAADPSVPTSESRRLRRQRRRELRRPRPAPAVEPEQDL